ncbi:hypothetical protein N7444_008213 [Penicillium canescens]|nr:hypothetical protein N7444_008213 [Penicillium canescens]
MALWRDTRTDCHPEVCDPCWKLGLRLPPVPGLARSSQTGTGNSSRWSGRRLLFKLYIIATSIASQLSLVSSVEHGTGIGSLFFAELYDQVHSRDSWMFRQVLIQGIQQIYTLHCGTELRVTA